MIKAEMTNILQSKSANTMTRKTILVLVVSSSGELQNGLLALTTTIHGIGAVLVAEDADSALRMVAIHQPALIILDMFLLKDQAVIHEIKTQWPQIHLIVLVDNIYPAERGHRRRG